MRLTVLALLILALSMGTSALAYGQASGPATTAPAPAVAEHSAQNATDIGSLAGCKSAATNSFATGFPLPQEGGVQGSAADSTTTGGWNIAQLSAKNPFVAPDNSAKQDSTKSGSRREVSNSRLLCALAAQKMALNVAPFPLHFQQGFYGRGEPIPTQWPKVKPEPIPTDWQNLKLTPIGQKPGTAATQTQSK